MSQTTIQKEDSLRFGSTKLMVGDDSGSLVDFGALRGMSFVSKVENSEVEFDNCPSITKFAKGDRASFTFSLAEIDLTSLSKLDGGLVNLSTIAGTPVSITDETHTITAGSGVVLANKNGDNSEVASIVVTDVGGVITYTLDTDYIVSVTPEGYTEINMIPGQGITSGQDIEVDYDYTPNTGKQLTFNTTGSKVGVYARIINTNSEGKTFRIDISDCSNITPLSLPFISDNADDVMVAEIELEGTVVEIVDEQSTT